MTVSRMSYVGVDGAALQEWCRRVQASIHGSMDTMTRLDIATGDGDHGITMDRGWTAIVAACDLLENPLPGVVLRTIGTSFLKAVGATVGPLYATGFLRMAQVLGDKEWIGSDDIEPVFSAFVQGLTDRGHAGIGDKTMMDVWLPAHEAAQRELAKGSSFHQVVEAVREAARTGLNRTRTLTAKLGRASRLGSRSVGEVDPGAFSAYVIIQATLDWVASYIASRPRPAP